MEYFDMCWWVDAWRPLLTTNHFLSPGPVSVASSHHFASTQFPCFSVSTLFTGVWWGSHQFSEPHDCDTVIIEDARVVLNYLAFVRFSLLFISGALQRFCSNQLTTTWLATVEFFAKRFFITIIMVYSAFSLHYIPITKISMIDTWIAMFYVANRILEND